MFSDRSHWTFTVSTVILILIRKYTNLNLFLFRRTVFNNKTNSRNMMIWTDFFLEVKRLIYFPFLFVRTHFIYNQRTTTIWVYLNIIWLHLTLSVFILIVIAGLQLNKQKDWCCVVSNIERKTSFYELTNCYVEKQILIRNEYKAAVINQYGFLCMW